MKNLIITVYIRNEVIRLKNGLAPVYFKLKINDTIATLPANVFVNAIRWEHTDKFTKKKRDNEEIQIRLYIDEQIKALNKIEDKFIEQGITYTAEMIKNRILKQDADSVGKFKTLADAFLFHKNYFMDLVAKGEMKKASHKKYRSVETHVTEFIKAKHKQQEFLVGNLNNEFQKALHLYLSGVPSLGKKNTVSKYIILFRRVIRLVTDEGWLKTYPLVDYTIKREKPTKPDVLTVAELQKMINEDYEDAKLNKVRDFFLFQIMTGLAYTDLISLEKKHITKSGLNTIIIKEREKTGVTSTILVQDLALEILERWAGKNETNRERCFPYISNKEYNLFIKVAAKLVGITKNVTTHLARHTYGCLLVQNNVDQKAQQNAMGHSRPEQTAQYARMFAPQVVQEQKKMDGIFTNPSVKHLKRAV